MKRILIILLVLIGLLAGGGYFLFLKAITPGDVPTKVMNAEEAISTSGTIAISSIDIGHVRRIDDMFKGVKDPSPLSAPQQEPKSAKSLLAKLNKQGINLYKTTDYALATINVGQEKPAYTFVLFGRYSSNKLKQAIRQSHLVDESTKGYWLITPKVEEKKITDPCAVPDSSADKSALKQQALHIQNDRILLSSPELMPVLLKRFANKARADVSLEKWRTFRKDKVVAGAFMSPKQAKKGAVDLSSSLLLGAVSNQPLTDIYAGAVVSVFPKQGFTVLVDVHSSAATWPGEVKTKYDAWLLEIESDLKEMPTLASLFQSLNVQADGNVLRFKTIADTTTLDNLEKVPAEFLKMIFENITFGDEAAGAEQIIKEEDLKKYASNFDFSSLQAFDVKTSFYKSGYAVGPFGVRLKKIGLLATDDSVIELKLITEGKGFENLFGDSMHTSTESPAASMLVTSVEDKKGNNILREELCGKTRNLAASSLLTSRDKEFVDGKWISKSLKVSGEKSVRLKKNVPLSQVTNIKGKIVIRAATRTKVQTQRRPFKDKIIETKKVRMHFKKSNASTVKYELSGDMTRILAVRAKNAKGQYLASSGSSASGKETKTISKRFKGKVSSIEVIVAEEMKREEYPFAINQFALQYGKQGNGRQLGMVITSKKAFLRKYAKVKYKDACKDKQMVATGAFVVCMNKFGDRWGREIGGEFDVVGPADEALQNDLSAGVLSIDTVVTESGEEIAFNKAEKANFEYKFDAVYNKDKKDWEIINKRLRASNIRLFSDKEELKNKKIKVVKGSLTIRIPKQPTYFELDADELGIFEKSKNGIIAHVSAFEDWSTYIDLQGPADKVMRFMPLTKSGTILKTGNDRINEKQYQTWGLSKADKEKIEALPKKRVGMITIYGKPEVIRVYYADDFEVIKHNFQFSVK